MSVTHLTPDEAYARGYNQGVKDEREACAKIAEAADWDGDTTPLELSERIAADIRARGKASQ